MGATANPPKSDDRYAQLTNGAFITNDFLRNPHFSKVFDPLKPLLCTNFPNDFTAAPFEMDFHTGSKRFRFKLNFWNFKTRFEISNKFKWIQIQMDFQEIEVLGNRSFGQI